MFSNIKMFFSGGMITAFICCVHLSAAGQERHRRQENRGERKDSINLLKDSSSQKGAAALLNGLRGDVPKPYKEVITSKAVSYRSFLTVHKIEDKYLLEIPDSILGREILVVNRIGIAPADFRNNGSSPGYAGDIIGQAVFHFSKGEGNRMFVRTKSYKERAVDSSVNGLARSLDRNNMEPIVNSFSVKSVNDSIHSTVIEITDLLGQDNTLFGFSTAAKAAAGLVNIVADRSYTEGVRSYDDNITFTFMRTYNKASGTGFSGGVQLPYTFQLRCGMILLPSVPMTPRYADKRTAYQNISYIDFDNNPFGVMNKDVIFRWRLEPADRKAYLSGKLTAPVKPVKIYIDPAMPAKWKPYIRSGIEAWNQAFKKAGFKNAIEAIQNPSEESSSYLDNAHHSAVVFMPGRGKSPGNMIVDPRSGEILQVQLNFYLSTLDTLYKQYFIQAGALDKAANKPVFDEALMGRLVEAYAMQAMGRLLGLKINAGASYENSIADLRNRDWLKLNAFNGSATDPVLVNYVVQPEDKINVHSLLPGISETDEWMINWGYRVIPKNENATLDRWIVERTNTGNEFYVGEAPQGYFNTVADPRNQLGDLGNDAVQAATLGISNLKKVVPNLVAWTSEPATGNERAGEMYEALLDHYATYVTFVVNQIGGIKSNLRNSNQPGNVFSFVPAETQKRSLQFLQEQVFETPSWLGNKELYSRTTQRFDSVMNVQRAILGDVMSRSVLLRLQNVLLNDSASAYSPLAFLEDLSAGIFAELKDNRPITLPRRELQKEYVSRLLALTDAFAKADNDLPAMLGMHSRQLLKILQQKQNVYTGISQAHITTLYERLYTGIYKTAKKIN